MNKKVTGFALLALGITLVAGISSANRAFIFEPLTKLGRGQDPLQTEPALEEGLNRARDANDPLAATALVAAQGWLWHTRQSPQEALKHFEAAIDALHKGKLPNLDARVDAILGGRGKGYVAPPQLPADLELWNPGYPPDLVALERPAELLDTGLMLNIGVGYAVQNQNEIARDWWTQCKAAARKNRLPDLERAALGNLAWLALQEGKSQQASESLNAAIKIGNGAGSAGLARSDQLRHLWLLQGVQYMNSKRLPDAIEAFQTAAGLYENAGGDERGRPLSHLGTALALSGRLIDARDTYERALALATSDFETRWQALCGVADIYRQTNDLPKAQNAYRECVALIQGRAGSFGTDEGKVAFLGGFQQIFDSYLDVTYARSLLNQDWVSLREAVETLRGRSTEALIDFRRRQPLGTPGLLGAADFSWSQGARSAVQRAPALPSPENVSRSAPPPQDEPALALAARQATFLEYYVQPERTLVFVRAPNGNVRAVTTVGRDQLRTLVKSYRATIGQDVGRGLQIHRNLRPVATRTNEAANSAGPELYRALLEPVRMLLPDAEHLLVIVPHDVLWEVPFEALPVGEKEYVVDRHLISYAASTREWIRETAAKRNFDHRNVRAWIVGNPRIDSSVSPCGESARFDNLPGAEKEAQDIAARIGPDRSELFINRYADRMRFLAWHPNYSIIHIAAHGFACPGNPNASGLMLSGLFREEVMKNALGKVVVTGDPRLPVDLVRPETAPGQFAVSGLLTAEQIASRYRFQADLVFLSACQSGAGEISGEGILGFVRAFEGAGARSVILSRWLVGDESTHFLTGEFYAQYLMHGDKAVALRNAVLETRKVYPRATDWAAFRLLGPAQ